MNSVLLIDDPAPRVRRLTLNRPEKRNALNDALRGALFGALRAADVDDAVSVVVIRGAGTCFSAGYDLGERLTPVERSAATTDGWWARHVVNNWLEMWDMATPLVAQVHGWCLAGGSELATACDLVYVADDAKIGYPPVRSMSTPDMAWQPWMLGMRRGMEALLTGNAISGTEAAAFGFATRSFAPAELEKSVLEISEQVAQVPRDLLALNKRVCHRAMEAAGIREGLRAGAELNALGFHQRSSREYMHGFRKNGVRENLSNRDRVFGDYRENCTTDSATESGTPSAKS
ncbi:enoyl-CoA hydratase-related protein [Mycolicibacterium holsaticum]|uniref:Enoyl-CoA hydratase n=1 Tax=Mycolicibacterium holsaticum TaxID=152142 RepID=A0A1E3S2Z6_9MYCO|nr:enoyl-CoA hydratase-related protein [Mycolicibacterium holsaticum]MDA4108516.1 enoyl-CoA hydratase [Mycolicibacterium holsaticum DSM 44478 = JCM 12374]ODQ96444.1 enoyl-CoA hydratase [Mycolicibacterium holsaticum]QZA12738.1 enoyl-CoA hydratase/isomerase family protein [Mycolicibacterium holsaticum DSM 44478 = JCM 12374]UNC09788.1 enoyl-CoA hydratase/isomerase family protein [Mycolicibacterium holsaticum DSM 44478 = JCM 12374]